MLKKIKEHFLKLHNNNDGLSIATAIVAIGFVLVLVSIILSSVAMNFKMRNMNVYSKDSFYSAEQVLDELEVGLEQLVQESLSSAYINVLTQYDSEDLTAQDKNEIVKGQFYENICKRIGLDGNNTKYVAMAVNDSSANPVGLYTLLKESTRWHEGTKGTDGIENAYGAFLRGYNNDIASAPTGMVYVGDMKLTNNDGIYLKNLVVYYRDDNGFVSTIKTDIHLIYPDFSFSNPNMPEIGNYSLMTDTALFQEHKGVTKSGAYTISIIGSSYAYAIDTVGSKIDYQYLKANDNVHIVATDINIKNGGLSASDKTELWTGDINVESSNVKLDGYTYVVDDLNIKGKDCNVSIGGYYVGYGNRSGKSINDAYYSSAILVNGVGTVLDLQYVKKLTLAGRAYVDISSTDYGEGKKINRNKVADTPDSSTTMFYTGESVSAKPNQLIYLVPGECIGVNEDNESAYNKNPLTLAEYNSLTTLGLTEITLNKEVSKLGASANTLGEYLDPNEPVKKVFVRTHDETSMLVYYYMNFASEDAANLYFTKYYGINFDSMDRYMSLYIDAITLPKTGVTMKVSLAGNAVQDVEIDGKTARETAGYIKVKDGESSTISESFADDYEFYISRFEGYCSKLSPDVATLEEEGAIIFTYEHRKKDKTGTKTETGPKAVLFENIVNPKSLEEVYGDTSIFKDSKGKTRVMLVHAGDVDSVKEINLSSYSDLNLIVADCAVKITGGTEFNGCIIAKGKIEVPSGSFTFKANPAKVNECLNLASDDLVYYVYEVFTDADELQFLTDVDSSAGDYSVQDLVVLENWTKNIEIN